MRSVCAFLLLCSLLAYSSAWEPNDPSTTGGTNCAGCTIAIGVLDQLAIVNKVAIADLVAELCDYFKDPVKGTCEYLVKTYGDDVVAMLAAGLSPDDVCLKLSFCKDPTCRVFTGPLGGSSKGRTLLAEEDWRWSSNGILRTLAGLIPNDPSIKERLGSDPFAWIKDLINNVFNKHTPLEDLDDIRNSSGDTSWRGKDCDDADATIYPGRKTTSHSPSIDHDCNGISGTDPVTGKSYEELYCSDTKHYGIVVLGDSASAHFHIPPEYMNASEIRTDTYNTVFDLLANEFDWPELSTVTGYADTNATLHCPGPVDSIYKRMKERNRCIHRDFQNIAVNGGSIKTLNASLIRSMARNQADDHPLLIFLELIGNDVCNRHQHTLERMTSIEKYRDYLLLALKELDARVPAGSHVILGGTADGNLLYKYLHDKRHPLGATVDITYKTVYSFLSCLGVSPCEGWMNDNETIRADTTARNLAYDKVYEDLVAESKQGSNYTNFDLTYLTSPLVEILTEWEGEGKDPAELIEPVDGFHPGQIAQALEAKWIFEHLEESYPELLGDVNPHNQEIINHFGDQGGY